MALWKLLAAGCLASAVGVSPARNEIDASISPTQFVRGGPAQELRVFGARLALLGLEINPAEGITLGDIKVREPLPEDGIIRPAGVKVWVVPLFIDPAAEPGERTVVAVTPQGRSAAMTLKVVARAPNLADPRMVSGRSGGGRLFPVRSCTAPPPSAGPSPGR